MAHVKLPSEFSTLSKVTEYIRKNPELLTQEVNKYTAEKLMMLLDNDRLAALEDEFNEHPEGIELPSFIWLMECAISHSPEEKYDLIMGLIKLFNDIDINGDQHMEWSEFTQFIIDAVIGDGDKITEKRGEGKGNEAQPLRGESEIVDSVYSQKSLNYMASRVSTDLVVHAQPIKKIKNIAANDTIAVLEESSMFVQIYDNKGELKNKLSAFKNNPLTQKNFIVDIAVSAKLNLIGGVTSDRKILLWESILGTQLIYSVETDNLQVGIWFLEQSNYWVTAGSEFVIRVWTYIPHIKEMLQEIRAFPAHTRHITSVVEITTPLLMASASFDGKINLWNLNDGFLETELEDPFLKKGKHGVKGIIFSHEYGGNLLAWGFVNYINIWCPESSLSRTYFGRLEGHSYIIACVCFLPGSPNVISIDERSNIRIWDIRAMSTVQSISNDAGVSRIVCCVEFIPKTGSFIIGGKRLMFYDNAYMNKKKKSVGDDLYPLQCEFNSYYNVFVVLTKKDVRLYDAMTGRIRNLFGSIMDTKNPSDLTTLCFGGRLRKFYVGDAVGLIKNFGMGNGELLKQVISLEKFNEEIAKEVQKKDSSEVTALLYMFEEKVLIVGSADSTVKLFNEDDPEDSYLMRMLRGGHKNSEITSLAFSSEFSVLASGSSNGIISMWDLEVGKLDTAFCGHDAEVTNMQFCFPYPALISVSMDGTLCLWGYRCLKNDLKNKCLMRIINVHFLKELNEIRFSGFVSGILMKDEGTGIKRGLIRSEEEKAQMKSIIKSELKAFKRNSSEGKASNSRKDARRESKFISIDQEELLGEVSEFSGIQQYFMQKLRNTASPNLNFEQLDCETPEKEFNQYLSDYDSELQKTSKRSYFIVGDMHGFLHLFSFSHVFEAKGFSESDTAKYGNKANGGGGSSCLYRKDNINGVKVLDTVLGSSDQIIKRNGQIVLEESIGILRWQAHTAKITHVSQIEEIKGFITSSVDKHVKIWSLSGELWGDILVGGGSTTAPWRFPYDWTSQKLRGLDEMFDIIELIKKRHYSRDERDQIKCVYMFKNYIERSLMKKEKPEYQLRLEQSEKEHKNLMATLESISKRISQKDKQIKRLKKKMRHIPDSSAIAEKPVSSAGGVGIPDSFDRRRSDLEHLPGMGAAQPQNPTPFDKFDVPLSTGTSGPKTQFGLSMYRFMEGKKTMYYKTGVIEVEPKKEEGFAVKKTMSKTKQQANATRSMSQMAGGFLHDKKIFESSNRMKKQLESASRKKFTGSAYETVKKLKYSSGEGERALRMATSSYLRNREAISNLKAPFFKTGFENYNTSELKKEELFSNQDEELFTNPTEFEKKIVARKDFLMNPSNNKPRIVKTKNKIYII